MPVDIRCVQTNPPFPAADCSSRRSVTDLRMLRPVIYGVTDHILGIMLERHHKVREHAVNSSTAGIAALMPRDEEDLRFTVIMTDRPFAVIPEDEKAFFAHGTKVFTAVR